ncbi:hypothetical protein M8J76_016957 [Diaphorina citri]|nr:hypothetical protein M8J76_016957 [Diaphorina citri]
MLSPRYQERVVREQNTRHGTKPDKSKMKSSDKKSYKASYLGTIAFTIMDIATTSEVQEKLNSLEKLLFEFYDVNTDNSRKQELEKIFEDFSNDPHVWKHVRDFIKFSSNFYVIHFSLMVIENTLKIRGVCSDNESWTEMKYLLQSRVVTMECAPFYIINKLIKVNAHIARIDWPHFYPDYFLNIFKLLQSSSNEFHVILGAKFLQITSEEFLSPREDISYSRKNEVKNFFQSRVVPDIFTLLLTVPSEFTTDFGPKASTLVLAGLGCKKRPLAHLRKHSSSKLSFRMQSVISLGQHGGPEAGPEPPPNAGAGTPTKSEGPRADAERRPGASIGTPTADSGGPEAGPESTPNAGAGTPTTSGGPRADAGSESTLESCAEDNKSHPERKDSSSEHP